MNKDQILAISRKENQNRDLAELEVTAQAGSMAARVGATVCVLISVVFHRFTHTMPCSPWIIYFSILSTTYFVRYHVLRRKSDVSFAILYLIMCLIALFFLVLRLMEVSR